jgi:MoaA/NifB/PqqE/SkfB family radical SAM enzyme
MRHAPRISWLRLVKEVAKCNLAGICPDLVDRVGITPLYANFWVTSKCSGRCRTCNQWQDDQTEELTTRELKEIILILKAAGVLIIYFVGGDILLREDIFELIQFATQLGLRVHLTINAFTVTEKIAQALAASNLTSLHLSLDLLSDDFDDIRGVKEASRKVLHSLNLLLKDGNPSLKLGLSSTLMKSTLPGVKEVVELGLRNNFTVFFNLINFTHDFFSTEFSRSQYRLDREDQEHLHRLVRWLQQHYLIYPGLLPRLDHLEWISKYFQDYRQQGTPCYQTLLKICIRPNGDVRPCCSMETPGNLRRQPLKDILASEAYRALLKKALTKDCPGCSCRYTLNLDVSLVSWLREFWHRLHARTQGGKARF